MAGWVESVKLTIEDMREHGERMPVPGDFAVPEPGEALRGKAGLDVRVVGYVIGVVIGDELVVGNRPVDSECSQSEKAAEPERVVGGPHLLVWLRCIHGALRI